jgi:hypothetical protein
LTGKGETTKRDGRHIERSGGHLGFKTGFGLFRWQSASGFFAARNSRNPSHVGRPSRPAKLEYRRDRI